MPLCLHPTEAVRLPVTRIVNSLISEFPVIASKENICRAVLELLSLSRSLCQTEFTNEVKRLLDACMLARGAELTSSPASTRRCISFARLVVNPSSRLTI